MPSSFSLEAADPFNPSPEHFEDLAGKQPLTDEKPISLDLEDEEPVSFINYQDFADQILDVFQSIQNTIEVAVDYKANAFNPITIKEVFEL